MFKIPVIKSLAQQSFYKFLEEELIDFYLTLKNEVFVMRTILTNIVYLFNTQNI